MLSNDDYRHTVAKEDPELRQAFCTGVLRERGAEYADAIGCLRYVPDRFVPDGNLSILVPRVQPTYMKTSGGLLSKFNLGTRATVTVFPEAFDLRHHANLDDFVVSLVGHEGWYARSFFDDPELVRDFNWEVEHKRRNRKLRAEVLATKNQRAYLTTRNSPSYAHKVQENLIRLEVTLLHIRFP